MKKLASIIIPVYNVEPFLRKCLDSVINQTYENIEILIVDDGSTDQSGMICNDYSVDSRVTVFHQANRGLSAARNTALNHAKGEYLFFYLRKQEKIILWNIQNGKKTEKSS